MDAWIWPDMAGYDRIWLDLTWVAGYGCIWLDMAGCGQICLDTGGYNRTWPDRAGYGTARKIWPDTTGYGRVFPVCGQIWPDMVGYGQIWADMSRYMAAYGWIWPDMTGYDHGRIWSDLTGYGQIFFDVCALVLAFAVSFLCCLFALCRCVSCVASSFGLVVHSPTALLLLFFLSACCVWWFTLVKRYCCLGCCRLSSVARFHCWLYAVGMIASCYFSCPIGFVTMFVSMMPFMAQFCSLLGVYELLTFHCSDCNARWLAQFAFMVLACLCL